MKKLLLVFTILFVFVSCKTTSKPAGPMILKFNLEKGKGYDYEVMWDLKTKSQGQESNIAVDGFYSMNIIDDDGKIKTISAAYKSMKMDMSMAGLTITLDSDKPSPDSTEREIMKNPIGMMQRVVKAFINKPFTMKVDAEGNVLELKGMDKIVESIVDSMGIKDESRALILASMKDQFSEQSMKDQFAQVFTIFPNKEIKVGDSWTKSYNTGGKIPAKFRTTYTVKEIEGTTASLLTSTEITSSDAEMEVSGTQTGNVLIDMTSGLMINGTFDQDMSVKTPGGITVKIDGKGRIKGKANSL